MKKTQNQRRAKDYDPRWLIWAIVFLVTSGTALVSYIIITDINNTDNLPVVKTHATVKNVK